MPGNAGRPRGAVLATAGELSASTITMELPVIDFESLEGTGSGQRGSAYRIAYALIVNTVGTTALGFVYWAVAAHLYSRQTLGSSSALVSVLILLSAFTQLNIGSALQRFLPRAGRSASRLIGYGYGLSSLAALPAAIGFVLLMPRLSKQWHFLSRSPQLAVLFVLAALIWGIFALEDAALTGLRRAVVVPVENSAYGVAKLVVLICLAGLLPATGIFVSWVVPLVVIIPVINVLIFRRYVRGARAGPANAFRAREIARFTSADYLASLFAQACASLLPLMVFSVLGGAANGAFYIAWTIAAGPTMVASNFGTSLMVEAVAAPHRLAELTRGVIVRCAAVTLAGAAVLVVAARPVLRIYGAGYAAQAAPVLAILAVAAIPRALVLLTWSLDRVAGRVGRAAVTQAVLAILVLGGSRYLLRDFGIEGVGYAWVAGNLVIAIVRLPTIIAAVRPRQAPMSVPTSTHSPPQARVVRRTAGTHRRARSGRHRSPAR